MNSRYPTFLHCVYNRTRVGTVKQFGCIRALSTQKKIQGKVKQIGKCKTISNYIMQQKTVIRSHKSKKEIQFNEQQKKKNNNKKANKKQDKKTNITQKTKDRATRNPLKPRVNSGAPEGLTIYTIWMFYPYCLKFCLVGL